MTEENQITSNIEPLRSYKVYDCNKIWLSRQSTERPSRGRETKDPEGKRHAEIF